MINFDGFLGYESTKSVAYAVCCLQSETAQHGLQMLVGGGNEAKAYLNGKQVYKAPAPRGSASGQVKVQNLDLKAGLNLLVFKVVKGIGEWKGSIRFTDARGDPVTGIKVTLDPEEKK